ncbi:MULTISPECIES: prepilin peptidase [Methylocystis]|jgi:Flp pilus assembly protein, protease CpaA|uniref:A24 family peptidase n=1 Tax=Methylocystis TaxID=133 RepID=UPI0024BBA1C7|nr:MULTISPECIES: prepilin peptidase [Methylocystis]MDJ0447226.1 prepilin peptidase [Methylocystis sp. JR02]
MIESAALIVFPAAMVFAAFSDLFTMTIPNRVSLILIVVYFALAAYIPLSWNVIATHVSCGLAVLALTFVLFQRGWVGGGDAKLASATALWLGWENLLDYGLVASIAGGALTLVILMMRWNELPSRLLSVKFIARLAEKTNGVPYGIALAIAGLLIYPQTGLWSRLGGL